MASVKWDWMLNALRTNDLAGITNPLQFKGIINVNTDFPLIADVENGWFYTIGTNVTDNAGVLYTNTGQSFIVGDEIVWNGTDWTLVGNLVLAHTGLTDMPSSTNADHDERYTSRNFVNGSFKETFDALATSNGTIVTLTLTNAVSGDLIMQFSDGDTTLSMPDTIELTTGTDSSPIENFIYIPISTKVLTKSTSDWPSTEHIKVGYFLVPSATYVQGEGCYINQNWNDHLEGTNDMGHMLHIAERIRRQGAVYFSGIDGVGSDGYLDLDGANIWFQSNAGIIYQMHQQNIPAKDTETGDDIHIVNDSITAYNPITDIVDIVDDSTGTTLNNRWFNLVFWMTANKSGEYSPVMVNLPSGSYANQADAQGDVSGYDVYNIPREFNKESSTGFLIARVTARQSGGTWTSITTVDLRGQTPLSASGGGGITTHSLLTDMPSAINTDHDGRYYTEAEIDAGYLKLDCTNDPLTGTLDGASFDFTGTGQVDGTLTIGTSTADDSLTRYYSAATLKYQTGWDESQSAFIICEDVTGTTDIVRVENGSDFIHITSFSGLPDEITADSGGVAASLDTLNTEVTTDGDANLDNVTLANGISGQIKNIYCVVSGGGSDSWKITPVSMVGGTQITFGTGVAGEGCTLIYADNEGWIVIGNNGGTIA